MPLYPAILTPTYTMTNVTTDRTIDCDSTSTGEVADVLCTFIRDMTGQ